MPFMRTIDPKYLSDWRGLTRGTPRSVAGAAIELCWAHQLA